MIGETKNYCLECVVHLTGQSKNQKRCVECPDRKDYLLRLDGKEPFHRGFAKNKLGFEPYDALKNIDTKQKEPEEPKGGRHLQYIDEDTTRTCKECGKKFPNSEINKYFQRNARSKDGYLKTCKKCMGQKLVKGQKKAKEKRQFLKPSNEAPPKPDLKSQPESIVEKETKRIVRVCEKCGCSYVNEEIKKNFSPHNTATDGLYKTCKKCMASKMSTVGKILHIERNKKAKNIIKIDFTDYPELLEDLEILSIENFRSADQQILAIIDSFLRNQNKND